MQMFLHAAFPFLFVGDPQNCRHSCVSLERQIFVVNGPGEQSRKVAAFDPEPPIRRSRSVARIAVVAHPGGAFRSLGEIRADARYLPNRQDFSAPLRCRFHCTDCMGIRAIGARVRPTRGIDAGSRDGR